MAKFSKRNPNNKKINRNKNLTQNREGRIKDAPVKKEKYKNHKQNYYEPVEEVYEVSSG
jgi:hypothetical protein